jgi:hypothetical protein
LFKFCLRYAKTLKPEVVFVLSAKYGLVTLDQPLEPYNDTLNTKRDAEIRQWAQGVLQHAASFLLLFFLSSACSNFSAFIVSEPGFWSARKLHYGIFGTRQITRRRNANDRQQPWRLYLQRFKDIEPPAVPTPGTKGPRIAANAPP